MPENYFDQRIAESYRAKWPALFEPAAIDPVVGFLTELAGSGAALEFGIGTGRIAIPLARRGIRVHGIDLSPDMVAQLRAQPGSAGIGVTIGDFAVAKVGAAFRVAYLLRNTITNLTSQDAQVDCFRNAAAHLEPGAAEDEVVGPLARELRLAADWQGLAEVAVMKKGGLSAALSREFD